MRGRTNEVHPLPAAAAGRCARHWFDTAVSRCVDCNDELCAACAIDVPSVGTFCAQCALARGGVRARRRRGRPFEAALHRTAI